MLLGVTATVAAACFCLSPSPVPEQIPVAPDAAVAVIRDAVPSDAVPVRCLSSARAWSHLRGACPRMLGDPFQRVGAKPLLLYRVR